MSHKELTKGILRKASVDQIIDVWLIIKLVRLTTLCTLDYPVDSCVNHAVDYTNDCEHTSDNRADLHDEVEKARARLCVSNRDGAKLITEVKRGGGSVELVGVSGELVHAIHRSVN